MPGRDKAEIIRALFAAYLLNDLKTIENLHRRLPLHQSL